MKNTAVMLNVISTNQKISSKLRKDQQPKYPTMRLISIFINESVILSLFNATTFVSS